MRGEEFVVTNSSETKLSDVVQPNRLSGRETLRRVFLGEQGIRAGWSALLFIAIYLILETVTLAVLRHFISLEIKGPISLTLAVFQESCEVMVVLLATWVMARIENRRLFSYGYIGDHKIIRLVSGVAWGLLCLSALAGVLWKMGWLVFDGRLLTGLAAWKYALAWGLVFLLVGVFEESLLRGYLQYTLSRGIGFWWAAALLSVVFLLVHVGNGESPLGLLQAGITGFYFCFSLWCTKSLWWAVGFHAGWDWAQSYLFGTPDSGLVMKNHLLLSHSSGNPLWSGGATGPEGSILFLPLVFLMATGMWIWWGRRKGIDR